MADPSLQAEALAATLKALDAWIRTAEQALIEAEHLERQIETLRQALEPGQ